MRLKLIYLCTALALLSGCVSTDGVKLNSPFQLTNSEASEDDELNSLEDLVEQDKKDSAAWAKLAKFHYDGGNYHKAIAVARQAFALDPSNKEAGRTILLSSGKLAEENVEALKSSGHFDEDLQNQISIHSSHLRDSLLK